MHMNLSARRKIDGYELSKSLVYKNLCALLPKANNYVASESGYSEELIELKYFGITTNKQLRLLLKKQRKQLIAIERSPIDAYHQKMYKEEMGAKKFNDHTRKNYWFAYPGLLRIALELEFGERYKTYAGTRDGI